jgi:hypothetical protein
MVVMPDPKNVCFQAVTAHSRKISFGKIAVPTNKDLFLLLN